MREDAMVRRACGIVVGIAALIAALPAAAQPYPSRPVRLVVPYAGAPRGTPQEIVVRLHGEINKLLDLPDVKTKLLAAGADVRTISIDEFAAFTRWESEKFYAIIKDGGLKPG
jgi:tripartite-type tricarboxylate transporter receptor subunit TctC